jgi:hypothetical protein
MKQEHLLLSVALLGATLLPAVAQQKPDSGSAVLTQSEAGKGVNPDADEVLRAMSKFIGATKAFSVKADISNEIITQDGQKLQFNSSATALLERPSRVHVARQGGFVDAEISYNGKTLTIYGKTVNAYAQKELTGTIDDALTALETGIGISLPGGDLLIANPYAALSSGITSSSYHGTEIVGGVESHHLAFRTPKVDWQLWVKAGDEPLPMKYVITTKFMTGAPQYSVQFSDWNIKPTIDASRFSFVAPKGAEKIENLAVDETGEISIKQGSK